MWVEKIPFLILGVAGAIVTYYAQNANAFITPLERYSLSARPAMVFYSLWFYLEKTVMPQGLSPLYELPARVHVLDRQFLFPAIAVTAITATVLALWRRWPAGLAVWAYYAIALGPVIGIVHSGHQLTNDRYSYLPGLGFALVVGAAAGAAARAAAAGTLRPVLARLLAGFGVAWLCSLAYLSAQQVQVWKDTETLWRYSLESDPSCSICHGNLGAYLSNHGQLGLAKTEFEHALALRPDNMKVHQHLGYTLRDGSATFPARSSISSSSWRDIRTTSEGLNNFGAALLNAKRPAEALNHLKRALTLKPEHVLSRVNLGYAYADLGRPAEALGVFREAIALQVRRAAGLVRARPRPARRGPVMTPRARRAGSSDSSTVSSRLGSSPHSSRPGDRVDAPGRRRRMAGRHARRRPALRPRDRQLSQRRDRPGA